MILSSCVKELGECGCAETVCQIPPAIRSLFDEELVLSGDRKRMFVTLGQFSIVRLERDTQLLIPCFDYCIPTKSCGDAQGVGSAESPCDIFSRIDFPVDAFFPGRNEPCISPCDSCTGCAAGYKTTNS